MSGQREILTQAKGRGYIMARDNAAGYRAAAAWWRLFENGRLPYVRVTPRRSWASVELDMDPVGKPRRPWAVRAIGAVFLRQNAEQPTSKTAWWVIGPRACVISSVPAADEPDAALELAEIALVDLGEQGLARGGGRDYCTVSKRG